MTTRTRRPVVSRALAFAVVAEEGAATKLERQLHQVLGARVVAGAVEADRVVVVRVAQAEADGAAVHKGHERGHRPGDALGDRLRCVVAAGEQHAGQQVGDRQPLAALQAIVDSTDNRSEPGGVEAIGQLLALSSVSSAVISLVVEATGRESSARRANRTSPVEVSTRIAPAHGQRGGGCVRGGQRGCKQRHHEDRPEDDPWRPSQGRSLTFCPTWIALGSSAGLRIRSRSDVTPVLSAIWASVSPAFTV